MMAVGDDGNGNTDDGDSDGCAVVSYEAFECMNFEINVL